MFTTERILLILGILFIIIADVLTVLSKDLDFWLSIMLGVLLLFPISIFSMIIFGFIYTALSEDDGNDGFLEP